MDWILLLYSAVLLASLRPRKESTDVAPELRSLSGFAFLVIAGGQYASVLGWPATGASVFQSVYASAGKYIPALLLLAWGWSMSERLYDPATKVILRPMVKVYVPYLISLVLIVILHLCLQDSLTFRMLIPALFCWPGVLMDGHRLFFIIMTCELALVAAELLCAAARKHRSISKTRSRRIGAISVYVMAVLLSLALRRTGNGIFWSGTAMAVPLGLLLARFRKPVSDLLHKGGIAVYALVVFVLLFCLVRFLPSETPIARCAVLGSGLLLTAVLADRFTWRCPVTEFVGKHALTAALTMQLFSRVLERETYFNKVSAFAVPVMLLAAPLVAAVVDYAAKLIIDRLPLKED